MQKLIFGITEPGKPLKHRREPSDNSTHIHLRAQRGWSQSYYQHNHLSGKRRRSPKYDNSKNHHQKCQYFAAQYRYYLHKNRLIYSIRPADIGYLLCRFSSSADTGALTIKITLKKKKKILLSIFKKMKKIKIKIACRYPRHLFSRSVLFTYSQPYEQTIDDLFYSIHILFD